MKKVFSLIAAFMLVVGVTPQLAQAATATYSLTAQVPLATGVSITANSINASTSAATLVPGTTLSFNPLTFNAANGIWLPDHYFSLTITPTGGAGSPDATFVYTEGTNPNAPGHGLGWKSVATFVKAGATETVIASHGKKMLKDLTSEHVTSAETAGGALKVYLGIVTKDPAAVPPDPAASEVFTNGDKAGAYSGTLVVTATVA